MACPHICHWAPTIQLDSELVSPIHPKIYGTGGAVAQMGERLVRNEEVRGSIPLSSTTLLFNPLFYWVFPENL